MWSNSHLHATAPGFRQGREGLLKTDPRLAEQRFVFGDGLNSNLNGAEMVGNCGHE